MRLPVLKDSSLDGATLSQTHAPSVVHSLRVLVVDDNVDTARLLAMLLCHEGHDAIVAADGLSAIDAVRARTPDVVLLDIGLPGMDGFEVCRCLRQKPGLEQALIVALTGYGQEEDRRRSQEAGFDAHLIKPIGMDQLHQIFSQHRSHR